MKRAAVAIAVLLGASCGARALPTRAVDAARAATMARLCEHLPAHAHDCVVGWPASASPGRRDAIASASEGSVWADAPGVRAYASCTDRAAEEGHVAHVITLLVDTSLGSAEEIAERLPVRVRWTQACESETDDCASYLARTDGDRLLLTRSVVRDSEAGPDVAHLACAAVADGAVEAHARRDEEDATIRELRVEDAGIAITTRRPGGRGTTERVHRSWTELELDARDERLEQEGAARATTLLRPIDPEAVDVANVTALDLQVHARMRRLARDRSDAALSDLARLAERGFSAHPSRPDLGVLAVESWLGAGEATSGGAIVSALREILGDDAPDVARLGLATAIASGDTDAVSTRLARVSRSIDASALASVSAALVERFGRRAMDAATLAALAPATQAMLLATTSTTIGGAHVRDGPTVRVSSVPWILAALHGGPIVGDVVACTSTALETAITRSTTTHGALMTIAAHDHCVAAVLDDDARFDLASAARAATDGMHGVVRVSIVDDGRSVALAGSLDASQLRVSSADPGVSAREIERAAREVAAPLEAIGSRVFPAPTLSVPLSVARRAAAVAATTALAGVTCRAVATGVECELESGESADRLVDAAIAMFRAGG